jgi:hypothetical protein
MDPVTIVFQWDCPSEAPECCHATLIASRMWISVILPPKQPSKQVFQSPSAAAAAVQEAIKQ